MKRKALLIIFLSLAVHLHSQHYTLTVSPTYSNFFYYAPVVGGPSGNAKLGLDVSFDFITTRDSWFQIGTGIEYQHLNVEVVPAYTGEPVINFDDESINLVSLSFKTVYNLGNEFFLSANPLLDIQMSKGTIDNQTGVGISFSGGKRFILTEKMFFTIEPMLWIHNIIPFVDRNLPQRMTVVGIKAGLTIK